MVRQKQFSWSRRGSVVLMLWFCFVSLSGCGSERELLPRDGSGWTGDPSPMILESVKVTSAPVLDGQVDDVWSKARPLTVYVREAMGGDHPKPVILRSVHTDDSFFILAQWPDATRSDMRDPYIWNKEKQAYYRPSRPDDQFAIQFPMTKDFAISMLTMTHSFKSDVWHWKAGRGNPIGWVDDNTISSARRPSTTPRPPSTTPQRSHGLHPTRPGRGQIPLQSQRQARAIRRR